jgi:hypothetical protein
MNMVINEYSFVLILVGIVCLAVVVPILVYFSLKARRVESELLLKRELTERGMCAADICAVVEASAGRKTDADLASERRVAQHGGAGRRVV